MRVFRKRKKRNKQSSAFRRESLPTEGLGPSVFIAYGIVLLNVLLIILIAFFVLFLRGLVNYMGLILLIGLSLILIAVYALVKRIKKENQALKQMLLLPEFADKELEISLLGDIAPFYVNKTKEKDVKRLGYKKEEELEIEKLSELARLYEKNLLTREEYELAKKQIFRKTRENGPIEEDTIELISLNPDKKES